MKKIICIALCVLMTAALLPALADTFYNSLAYSFAFDYPEEGYYDDTSDAGYDQDNSNWYAGSIFAYADDGLNWDIYIYQENDYASFNLSDHTPETDSAFSDYCAAFESWFASKELETIGYCRSTKDNVIFAVGRGINPDRGQVVIADTMMYGWEVNIVFYAYADGSFTDYRDLTNADYELIGQILESFARK